MNHHAPRREWHPACPRRRRKRGLDRHPTGQSLLREGLFHREPGSALRVDHL